MKLFSFRIRAISVFILDTGMSTRRCRDAQALRIRVNMSAIGSVMLMWSLLSSRIHSDVEEWGYTRRTAECELRTKRPEVVGTQSGVRSTQWCHQLAFRTPGIIPESASSRKQMR